MVGWSTETVGPCDGPESTTTTSEERPGPYGLTAHHDTYNRRARPAAHPTTT